MTTQQQDRQMLLKKVAELHKAIDEEAALRMEVMRSKEYQAAEADAEATQHAIDGFVAEKNAIMARMQEMIAEVPDSRFDLEIIKDQLIALMNLEGVEGYAENGISISGKFSEKRTVDGRRLLETLGGDIDEFVALIKPTQKAVKDYAQERPDMKKALLNCIKLESRELVDVDIQFTAEQ